MAPSQRVRIRAACLWLALGMTACSQDRTRVTLAIFIDDGALDPPLTAPPWLQVRFGGFGSATVDPTTVEWRLPPPQMSIDLAFEIQGLGKGQEVGVDVQARPEPAAEPILEGTGVARSGQIAPVPLEKPRPPGGSGGSGGGGGALGNGGSGGSGGGHPDSGGPGGSGGHPDGAAGAGAAGGNDGGPGGQDCGNDHVPPPPPTCSDYCSPFVQNCGASPEACDLACRGLRWEQIGSVSPTGNTLTCRHRQAALAVSQDPDVKEPACEAASPEGSGECGTRCATFCDAAVTLCGATSFAPDCRSFCGTFENDPTIFACRLGALIEAGLAAEVGAAAAACERAAAADAACRDM